jgi:hypothetical protein
MDPDYAMFLGLPYFLAVSGLGNLIGVFVLGIIILWGLFKVTKFWIVKWRQKYQRIDVERGTSMFNPNPIPVTIPPPAYTRDEQVNSQSSPRCRCVRCIFVDKDCRKSDEGAVFEMVDFDHDTRYKDGDDNDGTSVASSHSFV